MQCLRILTKTLSADTSLLSALLIANHAFELLG